VLEVVVSDILLAPVYKLLPILGKNNLPG